MAAEYEVNIKINTQQIERELGKVDKAVKNIGKAKGGSRASGLGLMPNDELKRLQQSKIYLGQSVQSINRLAKIQDRRARSLNKINELESKGLNVHKLRRQLVKATTEQSKRRLGSAEKEFRILEKNLRLEQSKLRILKEQQKGFLSSPIRGTATMAGSPAQIAASARAGGPRSPIRGAANIAGSPEARRAARQRLEQVGLGAGFPLLFGGGAGSVIGGGLGGLTGSFGAQIALSAIGQQIDQFITFMNDTAKAFGSLTETLDMMRERSLFSSKETERLAEKLEKLGDVEGLAELATLELASKIGSEGIESFQDLDTEVDEFERLVASLTLTLQGFLAGPLSDFLNMINVFLGKKVTSFTVKNLMESLTNLTDREKFLRVAKETIGTEVEFKGFGLGGLPKTEEVFKAAPIETLLGLRKRVVEGEFGESNLLSQLVKVTEPDRLSLEDPLKKEEARIQKRLNRLDAERKKVLEVSRFKDKIAAANAAEDQQLVIRLKGEQKIAEIEGKRLKNLAGVTDQREKDAINIKAATEKLAARRDIERELVELQRKRQEKFENTIEDLDHQLALVRATTKEERERLRIEQKLKKLREDDKLSQPQLDDIRSRMEALAEEKNLINTFIRETQAQIEKLSDPMFQIISLATTLGNAFSQSFRGIVNGSMSAQQALANLFQRTADHFLDMAAQMIAAQIKMQAVNLFMSFFSPTSSGTTSPTAKAGTNIPSLAPSLGGGGPLNDPKGLFTPPTLISQRAIGGAVGAGRPYMVGERGPELFVPGAQGNIVPNNAMGAANVTVNVDASGSSVEGNSDQAAQLGRMLGAAVQAELVKQKRPGGLLAS